jgi:hypothetical protein
MNSIPWRLATGVSVPKGAMAGIGQERSFAASIKISQKRTWEWLRRLALSPATGGIDLGKTMVAVSDSSDYPRGDSHQRTPR